MIILLTRNSTKDFHAFFCCFFVCFFLSRKMVSKVHVTCHNHGHTSLSSARTFVEQNWPWLLSLELRNIVSSPPWDRSKGDIFTNSILTRFQLGQADQAEKINSKMFSRECGSSGSPKVDMIRGFVSFYLFAIFTAEKRHYTDSVYEWMRQHMGQEQKTAWICYQEEDEPQKLHNFLISSLPDTWLNSVVQWAALTSTFCMICKTDFCRAYFYY